MAKSNLIGGRYLKGKRLGKGSFGEVFAGCEVASDAQVAIKTEPVKSLHPSLFGETKALRELQGVQGIPSVHWSGCDTRSNYLVMDLLGVSLERLLHTCKGRFSLQNVLQLGQQLISRLEAIHARGYIHKDIKPANCAMGLSDPKVLYLLDFGLAKKYLDLRTRTHMVYHEGRGLIGTARFASVNAHMGVEQSRRDDLESAFYMLLYMLDGKLPWQGVPKLNETDHSHRVAEIKMSLVLGKQYPVELQQMLAYIRRLRFEEKPDYNFLQRLLHTIALRESLPATPSFDWEVPRSHADSLLSTPSNLLISPNPSPRRMEDCPSMQPFAVPDLESTIPRRWPRLSPAARLAIKQSRSPERGVDESSCVLF